MMKAIPLAVALPACAVLAAPGGALRATDYKKDVLPIVMEHCVSCHSEEHEVRGGLVLDDLDELRISSIGQYNLVRPGDPENSDFLARLRLDPGHNDFMPRRGDPLRRRDIDKIEKWIAAGAVVDSEAPSEAEQARMTEAREVAEGRTQFVVWTSKDGRTIEARFHSLQGEAVRVIMRDGRSFTVPFESLNEESVAQAKRFAGE